MRHEHQIHTPHHSKSTHGVVVTEIRYCRAIHVVPCAEELKIHPDQEIQKRYRCNLSSTAH
jgi:hypothetical protein